MFRIGLSEFILVVLLAIILFGASGFSESARLLGRIVGQLKRIVQDIRAQMLEAPTDNYDCGR
ncbi:MAG: twin-arginine translocase TatA/TatE family subunit [Candidatus Omnitrophica bacterium]|nr:twin-arginine translocase TatA/TatE family subunit [Candidatus Omnitrophota bacterium]